MGTQTPVVFVEPLERIDNPKLLIAELAALAQTNSLTGEIQHIFIETQFPVDIRHNAKIFREKLAVKAAALLKKSAQSGSMS